MVAGHVGGPDPQFDGQAAAADVEAGTGGNRNVIIDPIELQGLAHLTRRRHRRTIVEGAVVAALNVIGAAVAGPPATQAGGGRGTLGCGEGLVSTVISNAAGDV